MEKDTFLRDVFVGKQDDAKMQKILLLQRIIRSYYVRRQFQQVRNEYLKTLSEIEGEVVIKPVVPSPKKQEPSNEKAIVAAPSKNELLRKRQEIAIELLWLEQAIQSRKDYLRLKPRYLNPAS